MRCEAHHTQQKALSTLDLPFSFSQTDFSGHLQLPRLSQCWSARWLCKNW